MFAQAESKSTAEGSGWKDEFEMARRTISGLLKRLERVYHLEYHHKGCDKSEEHTEKARVSTLECG